MGGFIGGIVTRGNQLPNQAFERMVASIGRRGAGTPFAEILGPNHSTDDINPQSTIYLASAREADFSANEKSPSVRHMVLIDGFPESRDLIDFHNPMFGQSVASKHSNEDLLDRICLDRGPFAFAMLEPSRASIILGRDILGRKSIYYFQAADQFWFSTDLPTLLCATGIPRRPNPSSVYQYLRHGSWDTIDQTLFADIHQVPPGAVFEISLDNPGVHRVKEQRQFAIPQIVPVSLNEAVSQTRSAFLRSIEDCIPINNGPIGASLSGGMDSSSIVAALRYVAGPERELHTFSFITPEYAKINEEPWIDIASTHANTISHKFQVTSQEYIRDLPEVTSNIGEPLLGISHYLQYRVGVEAKSASITDIVDGISGDPVTGGHEYQVFDRLRRAIADRDLPTTARLTRTIINHLRRHPSRGYGVQALAQLPEWLHKIIRSALRLESMPAWMNDEWFHSHDVYGTLPSAAKGPNPYQEHVIATILESRTIRPAERNAAVNGIDSRMPFLDTRFVENMLRLPERFSFGDDGEHRVAFSAAMRPFVPQEILDRKIKIGFKAPDNPWLGEQRVWADQILERAREMNAPFILERLPEDIGEQKVNRYDIVRCLSLAVWADCYQITF